MAPVPLAIGLTGVLWPIPRSIAQGSIVTLRPPVRVVAGRELARPAATLERELQTLMGQSVRKVPSPSIIRLELAPRALLHPEEYSIQPGRKGILLRANDARGAFWAVHTLLTLLSTARHVRGGYQVSLPRIRDWPQNTFRAFMIQGAWTPDPRELERALELQARLHITYFALEFGPQVRLNFNPDIAQGGRFSKAQARAIIQYGRNLGLEPIGYLNLLGHLDRAYTDARFTAHGGIDIRTDGAYEQFVFPILQEMLDVYGPVEYFHCGMDEAWDLFSWLSAQGYDTASLLANHIRRVDEFVRTRGVKLVIWHDMLLAPDLQRILHAPIGPANGGPPQNTAQALAQIPKDVILDYWSYDPLPAYPVLDYLRKQGFQVWASPWQTPFSMVRYASARGIPTMGTLWAGPPGCFSSTTFNPVTALYAQAAWNVPRDAAGTNPEPTLAAAARRATNAVLWRRRTLVFPGTIALILSPAEPRRVLPYDTGIPQHYGVPLDTRHPVRIAPLPASSQVCSHPEQAAFVLLPSGVRLAINGVNTARGEDQLILFARPLTATGTNIYGVEVAVSAEGQVLEVSPYGSGNHPIPPGGFVLSAHSGPSGRNAAALQTLKVGDHVSVLNAHGDWIGGTSPARMEVALPGGRVLPIDGEDRPRGDDELILYTPYAGPKTTGTNAYGVEVVVRNDVVAEVHDAAGNAQIPQDGYVLSAHAGATSAAASALRLLRAGDHVHLLLEKAGHRYNLTETLATWQRTFAIGTRCSAVFLAMETGGAMPPGTPVAVWRVRYEDGTTETIPLRYGVDVLANTPDSLPQTTDDSVWLVDTPTEHYLVREWKNPRPGVPVRSLNFEPLPQLLNAGGSILAVTAAIP